ncbi:LysR family transcriptional regulator [Peptococcus simiae]|uniref:LysR family transcriptional regulator n=1 Tax=Peptococcus simiae TaxID=1643805 RepID=A0ABW9GZR9_9FIRM
MLTEYLFYVTKVQEYGSISKASRELLLSQQRLSQIIQEVEDSFEIKLFYRSSKGVEVTHEGEEFLEKTRVILKDIRSLHEVGKSEERILKGKLNINKFPDISAEYFSDFMEFMINRHESIELYIDEISVADMIGNVKDGRANVGIAILSSEMIEELPDYITFIPILERRVVVYVAEDSFFANKYRSISLKGIKDLPIILYGDSHERNALNNFLRRFWEGKVRIQTNNLKIFFDYITRKNCISIGSIPCGHHQVIDKIKALPIRENIFLQQGLVLRRDYRKNLKNEIFVENYKEFYKRYSE